MAVKCSHLSSVVQVTPIAAVRRVSADWGALSSEQHRVCGAPRGALGAHITRR